MNADQTGRRRGRPKGFNPSPQGPIQSVDRAFDVLEALAARDGVTLSELAAHLGQSVATMHRVLSTLERRRYVELSPDRQEWHVGSQAFRLGSSFLRRSDVIELSRPVMRDLMMETRETSNLGIQRAGEVLFVSQVETTESIRAFFPPCTLSPLHASGIGKALLSAHDEPRLDRFLRSATLERFTGTTITAPDELRDELRRTRERGYAFDDEERTPGMRCVAACIVNFFGEAVAGVSVSGPAVRLPDSKVAEVGALVRSAAAQVSERLGALRSEG